MLDLAVTFIVSELNRYLARTVGDGIVAEAGPIVDDVGKWAIKENHLGVALLNIEQEQVLRAQLPEPARGRIDTREAPLRLDLTIIVAAHFKAYDVALKCLGHVLMFFETRPVFTREDFPALDSRFDRLTVELQSLSLEQLNHVWTVIGGRQLPSVVYRVRTIVAH